MNFKNGQLIKVRAYGGDIQVRRLVEVRGRTAIISTDEECKKAVKERREPICIGVPLADVIEELKEAGAVLTKVNRRT